MANFFKIINITSSLAKRHPKKNTSLDVKYGSGFKSETKTLVPGAELFIICDRLPMNIQKLNLEKLIIVNRITENEYKRTQRKSAIPKTINKIMKSVVEPEVKVIEEKIEEKPKRQYRRKTTEKKVSVEE